LIDLMQSGYFKADTDQKNAFKFDLFGNLLMIQGNRKNTL